MLSSLFKRFYNTNNYKNVCFHYETIQTSYNRLKQIVNKGNIDSQNQNNKLPEINQIKEDLNRIKQHIENNDINYTMIYLQLDQCKQKINYLFRNL